MPLSNVNIVEVSPGVLTFTWTNALGETITTNGVLFPINFKAIGAPNCGQLSPISINSNNIALQATNLNNNPITINATPGNLEICNPNPTNSLSFLMTGLSIGTGYNGPVNVIVQNFTSISSFSVEIEFDHTKWSYADIVNFNPTLGLTIDDVDTSDAAIGKLTISRTLNSGEYATLPDNTDIATIILTAIGPDNPGVFTDITPLNSVAVDIDGPITNIIEEPNLLEIAGYPPIPYVPNLTFYATGGQVASGSSLYVQIFTSQFIDISFFSFSIQFDSTKWEYDAHSSAIQGRSVTTSSSTNNGIIDTISMTCTPTVTTLADGTAILAIQLTAIGANACGSFTNVPFIQTPIAISALDLNSDPVYVYTVGTQLEICYEDPGGSGGSGGTGGGTGSALNPGVVFGIEQGGLVPINPPGGGVGITGTEINITVRNFNFINFFFFALDYDGADWAEVALSWINPEVPGFSYPNVRIYRHFWTSGQGNPATILVVWRHPIPGGSKGLPDSTALLQFTFYPTLDDQCRTRPILFADLPGLSADRPDRASERAIGEDGLNINACGD